MSFEREIARYYSNSDWSGSEENLNESWKKENEKWEKEDAGYEVAFKMNKVEMSANFSNEGVFEETTFIIVVAALILSIPVVINRGRIRKIIQRRTENGDS